jgi:predicted dehydrogenase
VVEKPLAFKSTEAQQLFQLAREKGKILTVFQNRRWDGDFRTVQQVIQSNKLGRIVEFESHYDRYRTNITPETWKEESGEFAGVLYNLGSHMVDQAFVLFGRPEAVTAHLQKVRTNTRVNDYYDIRLEYAGFSAILKCNYLVHTAGPRYTIHGENGSFYKFGLDPQEDLLKTGILPVGESWGTEPDSFWGSLYYNAFGETHTEKVATQPGNYHHFYDNVYNAIRNGAQLSVQPEQVADVLLILEACLVSNREKQTIKLNWPA